MNEYRVTKYDPAKRADDGVYLDQQEWNCISDIGKLSSGSKLTPEAYLHTEGAYVDAVLRFFAASGLPHLRVTGAYHRATSDVLSEMRSDHPYFDIPSPDDLKYREDQVVGVDEIAFLVMQNLRGTLDCRLEYHEAFFVHFGWDYYMYVGCRGDCAQACRDVSAGELFVEEFASPHRRPDGEPPPPIKILVSDKTKDFFTEDGETIYYVGSEIDLPDTGWEDLRPLFGMSSEHPFFGYFDIDQKVAGRLKDALDISLDLDICVYTLDTTGG